MTDNCYKYPHLLMDHILLTKVVLGLKKCFIFPLNRLQLHEDNSDGEF